MSGIGKNIMKLRKERGLTQEELAKRMGYKSKSTINKIEVGINDIPQSKIKKFAEVLNTTPSVLMGWEITEDIKKDNDIMANVIVKMRSDESFLDVVKMIYKLSPEKTEDVRQLLTAFLK